MVCESLASKGLGLCKVVDSGFVVFCERAFPGEPLVARIAKQQKGFAEAYKLKTLSTHDNAVEAPCEYFGECGGCKTQNLAYEAQLVEKEQHFHDLIARLGKFGRIPPVGEHGSYMMPIVPCPTPCAYRNKMEFSYGTKKWKSKGVFVTPKEEDKSASGRTVEFALGLHAPGRFDKIMPTHNCPPQHDVSNQVLKLVQEHGERNVEEMPPYNIRTHEGFLKHLTSRSGRQAVMGLPSRLDCRQQYGQQCRSFSLVPGASAQYVCAITLFKSRWPVYPSLSMPSSSHGRRSCGQMWCSSYASSPSANASADSGDTQTIEQLWELYFADPFQWWDNRVDKKSPRSPDLKHKVTRKALWVDGWSTPAWVKARLKSVTQGQFVRGGGGSMNVQSARTTSEAIAILKNCLLKGIAIDSCMYVKVLKRCLKQRDLIAAKEVHNWIVKSGMDQNTYVANNLLNVYIRWGRLQDARLVFDGLVKKDVISWNAMIGGYAQRNHAKYAMEVFHQMRQGNVQADDITYLSILKACAGPSALKWGKEVHAYIRHGGHESDVRVGTALLKMYAKCGCIKEARQIFDNLTNSDVFSWNVMIGAYAESGSIDDARLVFDRMKERDVITWTVMIGAYSESGCGEEAYRLFLQMIREGFKPDVITYISILNACASLGALEWVKEVHSHALGAGLELDLRVASALVHMYAKSGSIEDAQLVFDRMKERNIITWTAMIGGLAQHGRGHEALEVFRDMNEDGVKPDALSLVAVLSACSHAGLLDDGRRLFRAMTQDYGIMPDIFLCNCMVDLLGRAGHLEEAKLFIDNIPVKPDGATWGALLGACRTYGNVELAEHAAKERLKLERNHAGTYVLLSNIYAAAGKWDQVSSVRSMMQERGIRKEPGRSWIEVDNKIHRFVVGDTSHPEAKEIYAELNRLTEKIKAAGYIPDTRLVLQNIDEEDKELALCSHSEKLAIAYGLMRTPEGQPIRVHKNLRVCSDCHTATKFISKVTGREILARDANRFHRFKDGVCSCSDYW